jgi:hypothetical protein
MSHVCPFSSLGALADRLGDHTGPLPGLPRTNFVLTMHLACQNVTFVYKFVFYVPISMNQPGLVGLSRSVSAWVQPLIHRTNR